MVPHMQLAKPPIKEAILSIAVGGLESDSGEFLRLVPGWVSQQFKNQHEQYSVTTRVGPIQSGEKPEHETQRDIVAILRDSDDRSRTVRVARDSISLSVLGGTYTNWDSFSAEFREVCKHYIKHNKPDTITRISTRFINEIRLPLGLLLNLDDWFTCGPRVPKRLPDTVSKFTNQIEVPCENNTRVLINLVSISPAPTEDTYAVLLDIDVANFNEYSATSDDVWALLSELHELKNMAFFGSLTERALELYK